MTDPTVARLREQWRKRSDACKAASRESNHAGDQVMNAYYDGKAMAFAECEADLDDLVREISESPQPQEQGSMKLRKATESVGWLNSEGPLDVSPTDARSLPVFRPAEPLDLEMIRQRMWAREHWTLTFEDAQQLIEEIDRLRVLPSRPESTCEGACNPFVASCGATFCTQEEASEHEQKEHIASRPASQETTP